MQPLRQVNSDKDLPADWKIDDEFSEKPVIHGQIIQVHGFQAKHPQFGEVTGSAAALHEDPALRAWYELLERIYLIESLGSPQFNQHCPTTGKNLGPVAGSEVFDFAGEGSAQQSQTYRFARSNGVAIHVSWQEACLRAALELIERHVILASWAGLLRPAMLSQACPAALRSLIGNAYNVAHLQFAPQTIENPAIKAHVCCLILFPRNAALPLAIGFGAACDAAASVDKACLEVCQRLGFLWGEEVPQSAPEFAANPLYHQEYYLYPGHQELVRDWASGRYWQAAPTELGPLKVKYAELASHANEIYLAKAYSKEAFPLVFGHWRGAPFQNLADHRLIHPIS